MQTVNITSWQAIAAIASLLASLAALFMAWLIYRARPLAVKAIELHSLKFKEELLTDWKSNLPLYPNISNYGLDQYSFSSSALIKVETSILFQDLPNHLPSDNHLLILWPEYRQSWESLDELRHTFIYKLRNFIDQEARHIGLLGIGSEDDENIIIESHFVHLYYNAILEFCQGRTRPYQSLKEHVSNLRLGGVTRHYRVETRSTCWTFVSNKRVALKAIKLFKKLVHELPTIKPAGESMTLVEEANKLCGHYTNLGEVCSQIENGIEALIALPLLPNPSCHLLKIASPPLMPSWIRRLVSRSSNKGRVEVGQKDVRSGLLNPLSLGILFFIFSLTLWEQGMDSTTKIILGVTTIIISVFLGVAVLCRPFRDWLSNRRAYVYILPLAFLGFLYNYILTWLDALGGLTGTIFHVLFAIGYAWIFVFVMVEASILSQCHRGWVVLFSIFFFGLASNNFYNSEWIVGLVMLVFGLGVLLRALTDWDIWDKLSL